MLCFIIAELSEGMKSIISSGILSILYVPFLAHERLSFPAYLPNSELTISGQERRTEGPMSNTSIPLGLNGTITFRFSFLPSGWQKSKTLLLLLCSVGRNSREIISRRVYPDLAQPADHSCIAFLNCGRHVSSTERGQNA